MRKRVSSLTRILNLVIDNNIDIDDNDSSDCTVAMCKFIYGIVIILRYDFSYISRAKSYFVNSVLEYFLR